MRYCDGCTYCCTICYVPELVKVEGTACKYCNCGCSIYDDRPPSCIKYECAWKKEELPEFMRPDICGIMVEIYPLMVAALSLKPEAISLVSLEVINVLDKFVEEGLPVVATGQLVRLPKGMPLGEVNRRLVQTVAEYRK